MEERMPRPPERSTLFKTDVRLPCLDEGVRGCT
jgi:hypothetical protein